MPESETPLPPNSRRMVTHLKNLELFLKECNKVIPESMISTLYMLRSDNARILGELE